MGDEEVESSRKSPFSTLTQEEDRHWQTAKKPKLMATLNDSLYVGMSRSPMDKLNQTYSLDKLSPRLSPQSDGKLKSRLKGGRFSILMQSSVDAVKKELSTSPQ